MTGVPEDDNLESSFRELFRPRMNTGSSKGGFGNPKMILVLTRVMNSSILKDAWKRRGEIFTS